MLKYVLRTPAKRKELKFSKILVWGKSLFALYSRFGYTICIWLVLVSKFKIQKFKKKKKGKNATQAAKKICDVYGPSAVSVRVAQIWFKRFQSGNFDVKDARRSGRPITDKMDAIFEKMEQDRYISSYDVAEELGIDHKTVLAH